MQQVSGQKYILMIFLLKKKDYYRCERFQGNFYRALTLPQNVETGKIKAEHKKGVLHLTLPKKEEEKEKEININVG